MPFIRVIPEEVLIQQVLLYEHRDGIVYAIYFLGEQGRLLYETSCTEPELMDFYGLCNEHHIFYKQFRR